MSSSFLAQALRISVPVALQAMLQSSFSIVDQMMVGQLGTTQIAAVEIGSKPGFVFAFVSGAIATVTGIMVSQYLGKGDEKEVQRGMSVNLCTMLGFSLLVSLLCLLCPGFLAGIFTEDSAARLAAAEYVRMISPVFPLSGISSVLAVEIRCRDHARYPLYGSVIAALLNTGLNWLLIFGHAVFPAWGIRGAALASVLSQAANLLWMIGGYRRLCRLHFDPRMSRPALRQYLTMLVPIVANELLWTIGQNINTWIYGHLGIQELAGMALTGPVQGLFIGALSGLSQAAGIMIGKRQGQHKYDEAFQESKRLCLYGLIGAVSLSALLILLRGVYVQLFRVEPEVQLIGADLLLAFAVLAPVKVQNMILGGGVLRSGGKTKYIMRIDMMGTWLVGLPLGLLTGVWLRLPVVWVYFILSQEELFRLLLSIHIFRSRKWMNTID